MRECRSPVSAVEGDRPSQPFSILSPHPLFVIVPGLDRATSLCPQLTNTHARMPWLAPIVQVQDAHIIHPAMTGHKSWYPLASHVQLGRWAQRCVWHPLLPIATLRSSIVLQLCYCSSQRRVIASTTTTTALESDWLSNTQARCLS